MSGERIGPGIWDLAYRVAAPLDSDAEAVVRAAELVNGLEAEGAMPK